MFFIFNSDLMAFYPWFIYLQEFYINKLFLLFSRDINILCFIMIMIKIMIIIAINISVGSATFPIKHFSAIAGLFLATQMGWDDDDDVADDDDDGTYI